MPVVKYYFSGMYGAGKTKTLKIIRQKLFDNSDSHRIITTSNYGDVIHSDRSGIEEFVLNDGVQVVLTKEWATNNNSKLVYSETVGPETNPFKSEFAFLDQEVRREKIIQDLTRSSKNSIAIYDLSIFDSLAFVECFSKLTKGSSKDFEGMLTEEDVFIVKDKIGTDLSDYLRNGGAKRIDVLREYFYEYPGKVLNNGSNLSLKEMVPDGSSVFVLNPKTCVMRVLNRDRVDIKNLGEADFEYARIIRGLTEDFYRANRDWNFVKINTSNYNPHHAAYLSGRHLLETVSDKGIISPTLEKIVGELGSKKPSIIRSYWDKASTSVATKYYLNKNNGIMKKI